MKSTINTQDFINELIDVFFHKFIYYVPKEIIPENALEEVKDKVTDDFFDQFYFIDNNLGFSKFDNEDAAELNTMLIDKRAALEQNTFKLVEKSKELTTFEFLVIIEKYYEYVMLFIEITEWFKNNVKKYNEDVNLSLIGSFNFQLQFFVGHLKDVCNYFGSFLDLEKEFDFSKERFVVQYLPDILARYSRIENSLVEDINEEPKKEKTNNEVDLIEKKENSKNDKKSSKKQNPQLDIEEVEIIILTKIFNVDKEILQQFKS